MFAGRSMLIILLCLGFAAAKTNVVVHRNISYRDQLRENIWNSTVTTILCDNNFDTILKCNISQTHIDSGIESAMCKIDIDGSSAFNVFTLSAEKALVVFKTAENDKQQYIKYTIVNFLDCKTAEAKVHYEREDGECDFQWYAKAIVIHEDETFDVFYNDAKVCGKKLCRLTLDARGNKVKGPIATFVPLHYIMKNFKKGPSSQSFIVDENDDIKERLSLITADGQQRILANFSKWLDTLSTSEGLIRFCRSNFWNAVDYETFDSNGNRMSKINIDAKQDIHSAAVQNLANGQFLLLIHGEVTDPLMKISSDGSVLGVMELHHVPFGLNYVNIHVDADGHKYCVIRYVPEYGIGKIRKECFDDSDFH